MVSNALATPAMTGSERCAFDLVSHNNERLRSLVAALTNLGDAVVGSEPDSCGAAGMETLVGLLQHQQDLITAAEYNLARLQRGIIGIERKEDVRR